MALRHHQYLVSVKIEDRCVLSEVCVGQAGPYSVLNEAGQRELTAGLVAWVGIPGRLLGSTRLFALRARAGKWLAPSGGHCYDLG